MKLLIAEDSDLIVARLLGMLNDAAGVQEIKTTGTLADTLTVVEQISPDLLVLDFHLPDGDAPRILMNLKKIAPRMMIAVFTNDDSPYNRTRSLQAGADWFFNKSTDFEVLTTLVQLCALNSVDSEQLART
jgi:two-component system OmpR family response regulator